MTFLWLYVGVTLIIGEAGGVAVKPVLLKEVHLTGPAQV